MLKRIISIGLSIILLFQLGCMNTLAKEEPSQVINDEEIDREPFTLFSSWVIAANLTYLTSVAGQRNSYSSTGQIYDSPTAKIKSEMNPSPLDIFGYRFAGWATSYGGSLKYVPGDTVTIPSSNNQVLNLYTVWQKYKTLSTTGSTTSYDNITVGGTRSYYCFTPSITATYVFESTNSSGDTYGYLYNSNASQLSSDDDSGDNRNFRISYKLYSGNTYYFATKWYSSSTTGSIYVKLSRQYNISYNANGGSGAPSTQTKLYGDTLTLSSTKPVRDLWQFNGWATSSTATTAQYQAGGNYTGNGDQTLYAVWGYPTGSCGTNATWIYKDNCLYISGSGNMTDFASDTAMPWNQYKAHINRIEIGDEITSVGNYAFAGLSHITNVVLPSGITKIGEYAFSGCSALTAINIPTGITGIPKYAFNNCSSLLNMELPENVTAIGEYAFFGCSTMTAINVPSSVSAIGTYAFSGCSNIEEINIPSGITTIEAYTFSGNSKLAAVSIPSTVTIIKEFAFSDCSAISEIVVPSSVTEIERGAFSNCSRLTTVTIPDNVETIGTSIFAYIKDNVTVKCYIDTTAYNYAVDNEIKYELMMWGVLEKPSFSKADVPGGASISISVPKGTIYYTTNGTTPTTSSTVYTEPFTVKKNMTIKAFAVCEGWTDSEVAEFETGIEKVSAPYASSASGTRVVKGTKIELYCETDGAEIWCTTDGNVPTESDIYSEPIEINEDTIIYAIATKDGMINSNLTVFNYQISTAEDTPVVTTLDATNITETSAKVSAEVDDNNGVLYDVQFIYYEKNNSKVKYTAQANADNSAVLTGLSPDTEYWYQVRAINEKGWSYGYIKSFKTDAQGVIKPTSVEINPSYLSLNVGKKKTLLTTILPLSADSRDVYWSSEDKNVATVDQNGVVTAVGLGNTRIKATTVSGRLTAYCNIDVISSNIIGEFDFSEHNMITNSSNYDQYGFDHGVNDGGNALMASAYLARWDGAVLEENDTYPGSLTGVKYKEVDPDYHVQNIIYLPYRQNELDNDEIKSAIMKHGAVYTALKINYDYFANNQTSYYLPQNVNRFNGGHAITIVGWDDNYSRANFSVTPPADGAFICKNSWGTGSGEDGYFYVSYYDKYIAKSNCGDYNAVFYNLESKENYNKIYQYDYLGPVVIDDLRQKYAYAANVYPQQGSTLSETEKLKAVSFYNYAPGTEYEIYIVTNYSDTNSLKSLGSPVKTGISEYAGYYTVNMDEAITLAKGTRFAVVIKYKVASDTVKLFVEAPYNMMTTSGRQIPHSSNARANKDESYISINGKSWTDYTNKMANANLCIKAFTETDDNSVLLQGIDNQNRPYEDNTVHNSVDLIDNGFEINPEFIDYFDKEKAVLFDEDEENNFGFIPPAIIPDLNTNNNYSEGSELPARYDLRQEECMTSVKNQGNIGGCWSFATYASLESAIKKSSYMASALSADGLSQAGDDASSIELDSTGMIVALGNTDQLKATVTPYDSTVDLVWSSSNNSIVSVSSHGLIRALGVGNAYVTVSTADGSVSATCAITVTEPAPVDSISINNTETEITAGDKLLLDYTIYPENAGNKAVRWEVSNPSIASVNEFGVLTAHSGGSVTVTAYSNNNEVYALYSLDVDDGYDCQIDTTNNDLGVYGNNIFGSVTANIVNKTESDINSTVVMAIYDAKGATVHISYQEKNLVVGENSIDFSRIYVPNTNSDRYSVKIFVWKGLDSLQPIAIFKETVIN